MNIQKSKMYREGVTGVVAIQKVGSKERKAVGGVWESDKGWMGPQAPRPLSDPPTEGPLTGRRGSKSPQTPFGGPTSPRYGGFASLRPIHLPAASLSFHIIHIQSTLNNTILTLTQSTGKTLFWTSAGSAGFKNSRKSTSYAAQAAAEKLAQFCQQKDIKKIHVKFKGLGYGKEACLKGFQLNGIYIHKIEDISTIAHNGCRLPKKRRM